MRRFSPLIFIALPRLHFCKVSLAKGLGCNHHFLRSFHCRQPFRSASTSINGVFNVPVGGNGYVSLSVVQPKLANPAPANVIIQLPKGPLFRDLVEPGNDFSSQNTVSENIPACRNTDDAVSARALADMTSSTVVTIDYRLGELPFDEKQIPIQSRVGKNTHPQSLYYRYPTPVHDTLAGFDWVQENLQPKRLGVMGTHIGGSLALMLALTEPRSVHAVAALEPICDWTSLDEYCTTPIISSPRRRHAPTDLVPLLEARERFFATHVQYFDSFASPILFLRSAGKNVPKVFPKYLTGPEHPIPVLVSQEPEESHELWDTYIPEDPRYHDPEAVNIEESEPESNDEDNRPIRRRKALSRWPPYGLDYGTSGPPSRYSRQPIERVEVTSPWVRLFTHASSKQSKNDPAISTSEESEANELEHNTPPKRKRHENNTVLSRQATEMVDVMRRACFWGRESGFGNSRVTLSSVPVPSASETPIRWSISGEITIRAGEWLAESLKS